MIISNGDYYMSADRDKILEAITKGKVTEKTRDPKKEKHRHAKKAVADQKTLMKARKKQQTSDFPVRRVAAMSIIILVMVTVVILNQPYSQPPVETPTTTPPITGGITTKQLPNANYVPDIQLSNLNDQKGMASIRLSQFRGKLVLIEFFTTGCTYCIQQLPAIKTIQNIYNEQIEIISISVWERDSVEGLVDHIEVEGITWWVTQDTTSAVFQNGVFYTASSAYNVDGTPTIVLVTPEGELGFRWNSLVGSAQLRSEIDRLLYSS